MCLAWRVRPSQTRMANLVGALSNEEKDKTGDEEGLHGETGKMRGRTMPKSRLKERLNPAGSRALCCACSSCDGERAARHRMHTSVRGNGWLSVSTVRSLSPKKTFDTAARASAEVW
jgi:hypothetical protein